jgi:hypothetical protein
MGAWSHEPFGNDTANDWAYGLEETEDLSYIDQTLDQVLSVGEEYLDASDAQEAIAAVEVIAKLLGKGTQSDAYTDNVDRWVQGMDETPSALLLNKAQQVVQRVLSPNSELWELWEESDEFDDWKQSIEQLHAALRT